MSSRGLSDAAIDALIAGDPGSGAPEALAELVGSLQAEAAAAPVLEMGPALTAFVDTAAAAAAAGGVQAASVAGELVSAAGSNTAAGSVNSVTAAASASATGAASAGGGVVVAAGAGGVVAKAAVVAGSLTAKVVLAATVTAASVGGAHVVGVVDVPGLPDRGSEAQGETPTGPDGVEAPVQDGAGTVPGRGVGSVPDAVGSSGGPGPGAGPACDAESDGVDSGEQQRGSGGSPGRTEHDIDVTCDPATPAVPSESPAPGEFAPDVSVPQADGGQEPDTGTPAPAGSVPVPSDAAGPPDGETPSTENPDETPAGPSPAETSPTPEDPAVPVTGGEPEQAPSPPGTGSGR